MYPVIRARPMLGLSSPLEKRMQYWLPAASSVWDYAKFFYQIFHVGLLLLIYEQGYPTSPRI